MLLSLLTGCRWTSKRYNYERSSIENRVRRFPALPHICITNTLCRHFMYQKLLNLQGAWTMAQGDDVKDNPLKGIGAPFQTPQVRLSPLPTSLSYSYVSVSNLLTLSQWGSMRPLVCLLLSSFLELKSHYDLVRQDLDQKFFIWELWPWGPSLQISRNYITAD